MQQGYSGAECGAGLIIASADSVFIAEASVADVLASSPKSTVLPLGPTLRGVFIRLHSEAEEEGCSIGKDLRESETLAPAVEDVVALQTDVSFDATGQSCGSMVLENCLLA